MSLGCLGRCGRPSGPSGEEADADLACGDVGLRTDEACHSRLSRLHMRSHAPTRRSRSMTGSAPRHQDPGATQPGCSPRAPGRAAGTRRWPKIRSIASARAELKGLEPAAASASASSTASSTGGEQDAPALLRPERPFLRSEEGLHSIGHVVIGGRGLARTSPTRFEERSVPACSAGDQHLAAGSGPWFRLPSSSPHPPSDTTAERPPPRTLIAGGRTAEPRSRTGRASRALDAPGSSLVPHLERSPPQPVGHAVGSGDPRGDP